MDGRALRRGLATRTASVVLRVAGTPVGDRLARNVHTLDRLFHNDSGNIRLNGEAWLLGQLGDSASVVFDVGANRGGWTRAALGLLPSATIHAFEPIPETFVVLEDSLAGEDRVRCNQLALSNQARADLRMWSDGSDGQRSSATAPLPGHDQEGHLVASTTGDEYVRSHEIGRIDLLKIDVEGHEMEVLQGFDESFASGKIDLVQFEFTLWAAIARRWLADYYDFFAQRDFHTGKLWPREVRWKEYSPEDEEFLRSNFVAARRGSRAAEVLGVSDRH